MDAKRLQLEAAIEFYREGDVLICRKLDRLARSVADVVAIEARLNKKGAALNIIDPAMDTSSPAGRLVFNVLASIAQFEREIMLTRQREGIARAKGPRTPKAPAASPHRALPLPWCNLGPSLHVWPYFLRRDACFRAAAMAKPHQNERPQTKSGADAFSLLKPVFAA